MRKSLYILIVYISLIGIVIANSACENSTNTNDLLIISGSVVNAETDEPVSNALVSISKPEEWSDIRNLTDSTGLFNISREPISGVNQLTLKVVAESYHTDSITINLQEELTQKIDIALIPTSSTELKRVKITTYAILDGIRDEYFSDDEIRLKINGQTYTKRRGEFVISIPFGTYDIEVTWLEYLGQIYEGTEKHFVSNQTLVIDSTEVDLRLGDEFFLTVYGNLYEIVEADTIEFKNGGTSSVDEYREIEGSGQFRLFKVHKGTPTPFNIHSPNFQTIRDELIINTPERQIIYIQPNELENIQGNIDIISNGQHYDEAIANIEISGQRIRTNEDGTFIIPRIDSGTQFLRITGRGLVETREEIKLFSSSKLNYTLDVNTSDYFPLAIGNSWNYYYEADFADISASSFRFIAEMNLEVISSSVSNNETTYSLVETWNGIQIRDNVDTTLIENEQFNFEITERNDGRLSFKYEGQHPTYMHRYSINGSFLRYYPENYNDFWISRCKDEHPECIRTVLDNGIGITYLSWWNGSYHSRASYSLELVNYELNN